MSLLARLNKLEAARMMTNVTTPAVVVRLPGETDAQAIARTGAPSYADVVETPAAAYFLAINGADTYPGPARTEPVPPPPAPQPGQPAPPQPKPQPKPMTPEAAYAALMGDQL